MALHKRGTLVKFCLICLLFKNDLNLIHDDIIFFTLSWKNFINLHGHGFKLHKVTQFFPSSQFSFVFVPSPQVFEQADHSSRNPLFIETAQSLIPSTSINEMIILTTKKYKKFLLSISLGTMDTTFWLLIRQAFLNFCVTFTQ